MSLDKELLKLIHKAVVEHGGELGGKTKFSKDKDRLLIFDGRVLLKANVETYPKMGKTTLVHCHVLAKLREFDNEVLDACVTGFAEDTAGALGQAAFKWLTGVAGPIRSFIDDKPVCMTCKSGVKGGDPNAGFAPQDYGFKTLSAFVGPSLQTSFENQGQTNLTDDNLPWFKYAAESASPKRVHLAKVTLEAQGEQGWKRQLEVDGHEVSHVEHDWPTGTAAPNHGSIVRYAVFAFPKDSGFLEARSNLDRAIKAFIRILANLGEGEDPVQAMREQGFSHHLIDQVDTISAVAFGRLYFESAGLHYQPDAIRIRRNGKHEILVPLMGYPAYNRGRAIVARMVSKLSEEKQQAVCLYGNESTPIIHLITQGTDVCQLALPHCLIVELGCSDEQMAEGMALREKYFAEIQANHASKMAACQPAKPWWQFW